MKSLLLMLFQVMFLHRDANDSHEKVDRSKKQKLTGDNFLMWSMQISNALRFLTDKKVHTYAKASYIWYSNDIHRQR